MDRFVHVMPVGMDSDRIVQTIKASGHPVHKVYLVLDKSDVDAEKTAGKVEDMLKPLIDIARVYVDKKSIYDTVTDILRVIRKEVDENNKVIINSSDADRYLTVACYIAAHISGSRFYISLNRSKLQEVLVPPLKKINDEKVSIIKAIHDEGGEVDSINRLIDVLEGKVEDQKKYMAQRARMSYHLNGLEEDGIVATKREGKNVRIILTELGKAYVVMFG